MGQTVDPVTAKDFEYAWKWALDPANAFCIILTSFIILKVDKHSTKEKVQR